MQEIVDRIIIFVCCFAFLLTTPLSDASVVVVLTAITLGALVTFFQSRSFTNAAACALGALALALPEACLFFPLVGYDAFHYNKWGWSLGFLLPLVWHRSFLSPLMVMIVLLFLLLAFLLEFRTRQLSLLEMRYFRSRDENTELLMRLEAKNVELMDKQDYEIHLATLRERNRIAREIHDNVGHMLSRSLLQLGALIATNKGASVADGLTELKCGLTDAMNSIRDSVHDLHSHSLNLYESIRELVQDSPPCRVELDYDMGESIDPNVVYCLLSILREALTNVAKHSNATKVTVTAKEHPSFYQLVIHDDGDTGSPSPQNGIGLQNMETRVLSLQGVFHVDAADGFRLFVTLPKKISHK